jgi:IS4 transposase
VRFYHEKDDREYEYITNNFNLSAGQITEIYKNRRQIETFFKRMKQNLVIKSFLGASENAVKNQIWIAMIYYLLVRYLAESAKISKKQLLKFTRLISEKCLSSIVITELYVMCRSKRSMCLSQNSPPIGGLFG